MELSGAFEYCNVFYSHRWLSFPFVPRSSWVFPPYSCDSCLVRWDRQWCLHHSNNSTFFFLKCSETPRTITQSIRLHQTATPPHLKPAAGLWLALGCYLKLLREEELANRSHATANVEAVWHLACTTVGCLPMEVWRNRVTVCNGFLRYKGGHTSGLLIYVVCLHSPMLWSSDITIMHSFIYGHFEIIRSADKPRSLGVNIIVYNLLNSTFFYLIKLVYISFAMIELYYVYTAGNEIAF